MNFNFGEVLTRAWQIIWKHKILWLFGILASCSRSNGGNFNGNSGGNSGGGNSGFGNGSEFNQATEWLTENWWIVVIIVLVLILISILIAVIGVVGRIALTKGAYKADKGAESLAFGELFSESLPYFWRVFGLSFLLGLAVLVVIAPFILIGALTAGIGLLCLVPLLCIFIPVAIVLGIVVEQANTAIVLEDLGMLDGFKRGWQVAKNNAGPVVIMALILGFGGGIVGFVFVIPIVIALFPLFFGAMAGSSAALWIGVACVVAYLPVILLINGIITAYVQSAWTLTFMRLTAPVTDAPVFIEANA